MVIITSSQMWLSPDCPRSHLRPKASASSLSASGYPGSGHPGLSLAPLLLPPTPPAQRFLPYYSPTPALQFQPSLGLGPYHGHWGCAGCGRHQDTEDLHPRGTLGPGKDSVRSHRHKRLPNRLSPRAGPLSSHRPSLSDFLPLVALWLMRSLPGHSCRNFSLPTGQSLDFRPLSNIPTVLPALALMAPRWSPFPPNAPSGAPLRSSWPCLVL